MSSSVTSIQEASIQFNKEQQNYFDELKLKSKLTISLLFAIVSNFPYSHPPSGIFKFNNFFVSL